MNSKILLLSLGILSIAGCASSDSPFTQGSAAATVPSATNLIDAAKFSVSFSTPAPAVITLAAAPVSRLVPCTDLTSLDETPTTSIIAKAADQDGASVSGETVYFEVEYGVLDTNSCVLVNGTCSVEWQAQVNIDVLTTAASTLDCFTTVGGETIDIYNSVTAWTYGVEHFVDTDGDGLLSETPAPVALETFVDTDDPYLDRNDNGTFDNTVDKLSGPTPIDGVYDGPDGVYNGPNCDSTVRGDCGSAALIPIYTNLFMFLGVGP